MIEFVLDNLVWLMLVVVLAVFSIAIPQFFQIGIFANIVEQSTFVGAMAIGLAIVIIAGNMDLSVESVDGADRHGDRHTVRLARHRHGHRLDARMAGVAGLARHRRHGRRHHRRHQCLARRQAQDERLHRDARLLHLGARPGGGDFRRPFGPGSRAFLRFIGIETFLFIPLIAWIAIVCFAVFTFIMRKTPFGRHITMIGGNAVATFRAGIRVDRLMAITFVLAGAIAGLAGWLLAIRTSGATANLGVGMLFNAFAAVVIGGVSLKGGIGQLPGVYAGVLLLSSIHTAINLMGLPAHYTQMILGGLVLAAVLLDTVKLTIRQKLA